jgi:hypothetical protein
MSDYKAIASEYSPIQGMFDRYIDGGKKASALRLAMAMKEILFALEKDSDLCRHYLFNSYFKRLDSGYIIQYQAYDFEVIDYQMQEYCSSRHFFRGPFPSAKNLASGNYLTVLGAAQLFGRFHSAYFPQYLLERGVPAPILNLSLGGAGPEYFSRPLFLDTINRGKACILQVLSGRSVGTERYPGMRLTREVGSSGLLEDRLEIYSRIWQNSKEAAVAEVRCCQQAYMSLMHSLLDKISVPVGLLWISSRQPSDWSLTLLDQGSGPDFGLFPQLVDSQMWEDLCARCSFSSIVLDEQDLSKTFFNQITGESCPIFSWKGDGTTMWSESYYPNQGVHRNIADVLAPWINSLSF